MKRARILAQAGHNKLSLAFIFSIGIMRGLSLLKAALVHRFLTYLSRVCKSRLSKKAHQDSLTGIL
jgi:hypothetical protein